MGVALNNVVCDRLVTILYLQIQKYNEAMKVSEYQQDIGCTSDFINIIMRDTKRCVQMSSDDTLFYDIWFSIVKTVEGGDSEGLYYCGPVKTSHKGFYLALLEKSTKECPGGYHIVMKIEPRVPGDNHRW